MNLYRVPMRTVAVEMLMDNGQSLAGDAFACEVGPDGRPGRLSDRLNDRGEAFLPIRDGRGDEVLVHKSGIVWARMESETGESVELDALASRRVPVRMTLIGGVVRLGEFQVWEREAAARLVDFLNSTERFVPLYDADGVLWVQRRQILCVRRIAARDSAAAS